MDGWHKTGCVLCAQNCGLEVLVEDGKMVKSRPDKSNPRSEGYACRKGLNVVNHQHHAQRLQKPLKKVDGGFEEISWDRAISEIAARLREIVQQNGPKSLAYIGGGGQGCHFEAAFGLRLLRGLGSRWHYGALAQELTGAFWIMGRTLGKQYLHPVCDIDHAEMLICLGWNGWMSHQVPQTRRKLAAVSKDPDRTLVVIDPRRSETARRADIHLAIRPGTDALLLKAMISIMIDNDWYDAAYVDKNVSGFDTVKSLLAGFDARAAIEVCELDYDQVLDLCRMMKERKWCLRSDLGILMNRHSTVTSWLEVILCAIGGRMGREGGSFIAGHLMPIGSHSDERDERTWRTVATDFPAIMGQFPPNVFPEEVLSDHPERLRAVIVSGSNPLRSYADTTAYERAFDRLDLKVTVEIAMTETAVLSDYVLPSRSGYESWDGTFFAWNYPEIFFQMRRPVVEPEGEPLEAGEIMMRLADELGLIPEIPDELYEAAKGNRMQFGLALMQYVAQKPEAKSVLPFVVGKTLGAALGSVNLAALWGLLLSAPQSFKDNAARAGFDAGPMTGEQVFQAIMERPEGLWVGKCDESDNLVSLKTEDGRINLAIPELSGWMGGIDAESELAALVPDDSYPLILTAGRHYDNNANTLMRNPAWNEGRRYCTLSMHPDDASALGLSDGQTVRVSTGAGEEEIELEVDENARPGHVVIPHGFGLVYEDQKVGANVNRLTPAKNRDRLAGTPLHRYVPCTVSVA